MNARRVRERVAEAAAAAQLLGDPWKLLDLAADALWTACPRGVSIAFTRRHDGSTGLMAARIAGEPPPATVARGEQPRVPWIVDLDHVPAWQRDVWIEPMREGVHGPDYFGGDHPVRRMIGKMQPEYGRAMLCEKGRMIAWVGLYVDARRGFSATEREALACVIAQLSLPLRLAVAFDDVRARISLAPRQEEIVARVAKGWTNKRIAKDLDLSPATVKTVLERLFRVSGAANRAALVQWWARR